MILAKTSIGQQVLKDRSVPLTPQQRAAFILVDGKRSVQEIISATRASIDDIAHLRAAQLVQPAPSA